jgi:hypothetical protein
MSRSHIGSIALLAMLLAVAPAVADGKESGPSQVKPRLGIIPMDFKNGDRDLSSVASSLSDFLAMDFKLSGQVEVKSLKRPANVDFTSSISSIIADNKLDYLLFGNVSSSPGGIIDIVVYLFDGQGGKLSSGYHKLSSLLDLSDAGDALFASLSKNVGTVHRGFCSIAMAPEGTGGYDVYLNGEFAGHNLSSIENLLNGKHFLEIKQHRPFSSISLVMEYLTLAEGERATIRFSLPDVLPDEIASVTADFNEMESKWNDPDGQKTIEDDLKYLEDSFADISSCPGVATLAAKTRQYEMLWRVRKLRFDLEASPLDFPEEKLKELQPIYASAAAYPEPEVVRGAVRDVVEIECALQSAKATVAVGKGDWGSSLAIMRSIADMYGKYGLEVPRTYSEDLRFLETLEGLYGSGSSASAAKGHQGAVKAGVALTAAAVGAMAVNAPKLIPTDASSFSANIACGVAQKGLVVLEDLAFLGGVGLIALGNADRYNEGGRMRDDAGAAARVYFGKRLGDAQSFVAGLPSSSAQRDQKENPKADQKENQDGTQNGEHKVPRVNYFAVLSDEPGGMVKIGAEKPRSVPCLVNLLQAGNKIEVSSASESLSVVVDREPRLVFIRSERARIAPPQEDVRFSAEDDDGGLVKGAVDVSWARAEGAVSYTCLVYSRTSARADATNIQVLDAGNGTSVRSFANMPDADLTFAVYARDARGYASFIGATTVKAQGRMPFLSDKSRPYYFLAASGLGADQEGSSSEDSGSYLRYRLEPGILLNLVPEKFLFGAGFRFDLSKSGVADWSVDPVAVTGDIDRGVFHVYEVGASSNGSTSSFSIGYGEGIGRYYFMPSLRMTTEGFSSKPSYGASIVIGRVL